MADSIEEALVSLADNEISQPVAFEHSNSKEPQGLLGITEAINELKEALRNLEQSLTQIGEP
jgi:hypothetical protein